MTAAASLRASASDWFAYKVGNPLGDLVDLSQEIPSEVSGAKIEDWPAHRRARRASLEERSTPTRTRAGRAPDATRRDGQPAMWYADGHEETAADCSGRLWG